MPSTSVTFGILLILIGVTGYLYGMTTGSASFTALIPAVPGVILALLGLTAKRNEGLRRHLMHAAVVVALLGVIAMAGRLFSKKDGITGSAGDIATIATALVCLVFVILAVKSFIDARSEPPA